MSTRKLLAVAIFALVSGAAPAQDADLKQIREEIRQMKDAYEKRIQELEKRLSDAEVRAGRAEGAATKAEATAGNAEQSAAKAESAASAAATARSGENAFNPAVSLILQGAYAQQFPGPQQLLHQRLHSFQRRSGATQA